MHGHRVEIVIFGNATESDLRFMAESTANRSKEVVFESSSSEIADAESAPTNLEELFSKVCLEYEKCVRQSGRVVPPEWTMPDLVRAVLGEDFLQHTFMRDAYYDVLICGTRSWGCEEILNFLDLVHYVF